MRTKKPATKKQFIKQQSRVDRREKYNILALLWTMAERREEEI